MRSKTVDLTFDGEQDIDALDRLGSDRRLAEPREIEELAPAVCPARGLDDLVSFAIGLVELPEPGIGAGPASVRHTRGSRGRSRPRLRRCRFRVQEACRANRESDRRHQPTDSEYSVSDLRFRQRHPRDRWHDRKTVRSIIGHRGCVEQQGAATQEISRNVQQASQGTLEISSNITDVQRGAFETGSASSQVLSAAIASERQYPPQGRGGRISAGSALGLTRSRTRTH
jgi:hypothetical protein